MNGSPAGKEIKFRPIRIEDNKPLEEIIRKVMSEFNANPRTTIIGDPALKTMFQNFQSPRSAYFIAEIDGSMKGGCGIAPLPGGSDEICELQRMFLLPDARNLGIGKRLLETCLQKAKDFDFREMYLETLSDMKSAQGLYRKFGFTSVDAPIGMTGHTGCNVFMMKRI